MVADAADGADGITGSGLTYGRYRDCPRSQPTLAAEGNLNSEGAEEGLRPAQPAGECAALFDQGSADAQLRKRVCVAQAANERARPVAAPHSTITAKPSSRDGIPHAGFKSCHTEGLLFAASIAKADRRHENFW